MSMLNICENEMDEGPLHYVRCRLQFQQLCNLMTKSPPLRWAVNLQLMSCSCRSCPHASSSHAVNGFHWRGKAPLPQHTRVRFSRSQGTVGTLEGGVTVHLTLALSLSTEERAGKHTCSSWGLKNSFQPKKLNWPWINRRLSGNAAVTERLYVDHGSATLHKWYVRLHVSIPNQ